MKYNISATECRELSRNFEDLPIRELSNALVYVGAKKKKKKIFKIIVQQSIPYSFKGFQKEKRKTEIALQFNKRDEIFKTLFRGHNILNLLYNENCNSEEGSNINFISH